MQLQLLCAKNTLNLENERFKNVSSIFALLATFFNSSKSNNFPIRNNNFERN